MKLSERLTEARLEGVGSAKLSNLLDEAAALARRVEGSEVAHVELKNGLAVMRERCMPLAMIGQRVRLVPEDGKGESRE